MRCHRFAGDIFSYIQGAILIAQGERQPEVRLLREVVEAMIDGVRASGSDPRENFIKIPEDLVRAWLAFLETRTCG